MCGQEREWTLSGARIRICRDQVRAKLKGYDLGEPRKYVVEVDGKPHSLKSALSEVTGEPVAGFTTQDAFRIFRQLGFVVRTV